MQATQGYGTYGANMGTYGYAQMCCVTPPPAVYRPPKRAPTGGGIYEVPPRTEMRIDFETRITDEEIEAYFRRRKLEEQSIVDLRPELMKRMIQEGKEMRRILRDEREAAAREREELELLRASIRHEREELAEQSAELMREKEELLGVKAMFRGGVPVTETTAIPSGIDFTQLPRRTFVRPVVESTLKEDAVAVGIGFTIGAGVTALALFIRKHLEERKKEPEKPEGKDEQDEDLLSDDLIIPDEDD